MSAAMGPETKIWLMTPSGSPASLKSSMMTLADRICALEGFHTTTLPSTAGAEGRLPEIEVKLKGVRAKTNPSSGLQSRRFQNPDGEIGWKLYISVMYSALNLKKSASSQTASISDWNTFFDCPSIVAALIFVQ